MEKKQKKNRLILWTVGICLLPILLALAVYPRLPEQMPIHWNAQGEVDNYAPKALAVFGLPVFLALCQLLVCFTVENDPKKAAIHPKVKRLFYWVIPAVSVVVIPVTLLWGLGIELPIPMIVLVLLGIFFLVIGNYLPKCRQNYSIGIRIPWTLNSEENWRRTHRVAGYLWMAAGVVMVAGGIAGPEQAGTFLIGLIALVAGVPFLYSYLLYKKGI